MFSEMQHNCARELEAAFPLSAQHLHWHSSEEASRLGYGITAERAVLRWSNRHMKEAGSCEHALEDRVPPASTGGRLSTEHVQPVTRLIRYIVPHVSLTSDAPSASP